MMAARSVTFTLAIGLAAAMAFARTALPAGLRALSRHASPELYQLTLIAFCLLCGWLSGYMASPPRAPRALPHQGLRATRCPPSCIAGVGPGPDDVLRALRQQDLPACQHPMSGLQVLLLSAGGLSRFGYWRRAHYRVAAGAAAAVRHCTVFEQATCSRLCECGPELRAPWLSARLPRAAWPGEGAGARRLPAARRAPPHPGTLEILDFSKPGHRRRACPRSWARLWRASC